MVTFVWCVVSWPSHSILCDHWWVQLSTELIIFIFIRVMFLCTEGSTLMVYAIYEATLVQALGCHPIFFFCCSSAISISERECTTDNVRTYLAVWKKTNYIQLRFVVWRSVWLLGVGRPPERKRTSERFDHNTICLQFLNELCMLLRFYAFHFIILDELSYIFISRRDYYFTCRLAPYSLNVYTYISILCIAADWCGIYAVRRVEWSCKILMQCEDVCFAIGVTFLYMRSTVFGKRLFTIEYSHRPCILEILYIWRNSRCTQRVIVEFGLMILLVVFPHKLCLCSAACLLIDKKIVQFFFLFITNPDCLNWWFLILYSMCNANASRNVNYVQMNLREY